MMLPGYDFHPASSQRKRAYWGHCWCPKWIQALYGNCWLMRDWRIDPSVCLVYFQEGVVCVLWSLWIFYVFFSKRKEPTKWYYLSSLFVFLVSFLPSYLNLSPFLLSFLSSSFSPYEAKYLKPHFSSFASSDVVWRRSGVELGWLLSGHDHISVSVYHCTMLNTPPRGEEKIFHYSFSCMMLSTVNFRFIWISLVSSGLYLCCVVEWYGMSMLVSFIVIEI